MDTWKNESGRNGMTAQLLKKKFNVLVINSDGKKIQIKDWKKSETYAFKKQSKLIIEDKHTREYQNLNNKQYVYKNNIWGD